MKVYEKLKGKWHLEMSGSFISEECALPQSEQVTCTSDKTGHQRQTFLWSDLNKKIRTWEEMIVLSQKWFQRNATKF